MSFFCSLFKGECKVDEMVAGGDTFAERTFNILIKLHTTHMILMNKSSNNGRHAVCERKGEGWG